MTNLVNYTLRAGNAIPVMCGNSYDPSTGNIVFTFGTECQEIISCGYTTQVLKSTDMCLLGGEYYTATYKALQGRSNGKLVFNSSLAKKPIISNNYGQCAGTEGGPRSLG